MKIKRVKAEIANIRDEREISRSYMFGGVNDRRELIALVKDEFIDHSTVEITHEIEVPETIKEFCEVNLISKSELVDWLNDNYKQI